MVEGLDSSLRWNDEIANRGGNMMREFQQSSLFYGANAPYVEELYEQYLVDPASVPETWRKQFDSLPNVAGNVAPDVAIRRSLKLSPNVQNKAAHE